MSNLPASSPQREVAHIPAPQQPHQKRSRLDVPTTKTQSCQPQAQATTRLSSSNHSEIDSEESDRVSDEVAFCKSLQKSLTWLEERLSYLNQGTSRLANEALSVLEEASNAHSRTELESIASESLELEIDHLKKEILGLIRLINGLRQKIDGFLHE